MIGQVGGAASVGGCTCSAFQRTTEGAPGYAFPFSGILTKFRVFVGEQTQPSDTFQARTFRALSATNASVIDGGETHSLSGLPLSAPSTFLDRIPAAAGDLLGARFAVNPIRRRDAALLHHRPDDRCRQLRLGDADPIVGARSRRTTRPKPASTSKRCSSPTKTATATATPRRTSASARRSRPRPARGRSSAATCRVDGRHRRSVGVCGSRRRWAGSPPRRPSTASSSAGGPGRAIGQLPRPRRGAQTGPIGFFSNHGPAFQRGRERDRPRAGALSKISTFQTRLSVASPIASFPARIRYRPGLCRPEGGHDPGFSGERRRRDVRRRRMTAARRQHRPGDEPQRHRRSTTPITDRMPSQRHPSTTPTSSPDADPRRLRRPRRQDECPSDASTHGADPARDRPAPAIGQARPRSATSRPCRRSSGSKRAARWSPGAGLIRARR